MKVNPGTITADDGWVIVAVAKEGCRVIEDGEHPLPTGGVLHVWTQGEERWCCVAYDHGPMCRRCVRMEEPVEAVLQNVLEGNAVVKDDPDKGMVFQITAAGEHEARRILGIDE